MSNQPPVGRHTILDMFECECPEQLLKFYRTVERDVEKIAAHFSVLGIQFEQFDPYSWSANVLLKESHLSFHTWSEIHFVSADLYTCGDKDPAPAIKDILHLFLPKKTVRTDIKRGTMHPSFHTETLGVNSEVRSFAR